MGSNLLIPNFENGEFLSEAELYQLAWLPFELYRLGNMARGHAGFFCPEAGADSDWNRFDLDLDRFTIRKLFVVSAQGVPFIVTRPRKLDLSEVTIDRTTLFASAYFAENSQALKDGHFLATLGSDEMVLDDDLDSGFDIPLFAEFGAPGEQGSARAPNAYRVLFHWGEDTAPEIAGAKRFDLELGRIGGADSTRFTLLPTAFYPEAVPALAEAVTAFRESVAIYVDLLLAPGVAPGVDRSTLLDRCELLAHGLSADHTPTRQIIADIQRVLSAAVGFLLRIVFSQNPRDLDYRDLRGLEGRMLEHQLRLRFRGGRDPLSELIADFVAVPSRSPDTGQAQIDYFRQLGTLFDLERTEAALADLQPPAEPPNPRKPRRKSTPVEPEWVDIGKKSADGE